MRVLATRPDAYAKAASGRDYASGWPSRIKAGAPLCPQCPAQTGARSREQGSILQASMKGGGDAHQKPARMTRTQMSVAYRAAKVYEKIVRF
jgi:hypothetical protein